MPHTFNRLAFDAGRTSGNILLGLYCSLVTVELALKDNSPTWPRGHAIQQWLNNFNDAGLTALTYALATEMQTLICTDRVGNESCVAVNSYPDLRYLRHETDYAGKTTDASITKCMDLLNDIRVVLTQRGIL